MENSSHAILMASGVIIAMAIVGLLLFTYKNYSTFKQSQHDSTKQEQIVEYNKKIESYNKRAMKGNEFLSLINLVSSRNTENDENHYNMGYPEIQVWVALLQPTRETPTTPLHFVSDSYYTDSNVYQPSDANGNFYAGTTDNFRSVLYGRVNLNNDFTSNGRINTNFVTNLKKYYFQCDEIVYDNNGYVEAIYVKQLFDTHNNRAN